MRTKGESYDVHRVGQGRGGGHSLLRAGVRGGTLPLGRVSKSAVQRATITLHDGERGRPVALDSSAATSILRSPLPPRTHREHKKVTDVKVAHDDTKRRLEGALRDQRSLSKRVGEVERKNTTLSRKPEDEFWGEEAGRRCVRGEGGGQRTSSWGRGRGKCGRVGTE